MHRFMVKIKSAGIFNRILQAWNRSKSAKKFAEMLWAKNAPARVYLLRIKYRRRLTVVYSSLIHRWRAKPGEPASRRAAQRNLLAAVRRGKLPTPRQCPGGEANALFNPFALREMPRNLPGLTGRAPASSTRMTPAVSASASPVGSFGFISCKSSSKESVPCFGARRSCASCFRRVTSPSGRFRKWRPSKNA